MQFSRFTLEPHIAGTLLGIVSAVGYTAANVCLRQVTDCDPVWVSCVKAAPTVVFVLPWVLGRMARSQTTITSAADLLALVAAGLFGQFAGNVAFQWALGVVGIALTVPLTLGAMIVSGVILGRWFLGEAAGARVAAASAMLILAICVLSLGARQANLTVALATGNDGQLWMVVAGVASALLSGLAYCVLGVVIRHVTTRGTPVSTVLLTVGLMGVLSLGGLSWARLGGETILQTNRQDLVIMLLAGVGNAVAFLALTKALHLTGVVFVNALNASQTAMAAVAGVILFNEAPTVALSFGVGLTIVGLLMMKRRRSTGETTRRPADPPVVHPDPSPADGPCIARADSGDLG